VWRSYARALETEFVSKERPDVLHAHYAYPDGYAAVQLARRVDIPVVVTVHGHDLKDLAVSNRRLRNQVRDALQGANAVIAVSEELGERARGLGVPAERIHVIPNGADCEQFAAQPLRKRICDEWNLLFVGRFDPAKGIGVLIAATAELRRLGKQVRVRFVGGSASTGKSDFFQRQAIELGIDEFVEFDDEVPSSAMPEVMGGADLFVLPSFSEGMPTVMIEALAAGLPVVVTRCGGPTEVVNDRLGRLVEIGSVEDLCSAIADSIDQYENFDRNEIRNQAREQFDYKQIAQRIAQVYESVVARTMASP
tara:strand:+ start:3747 stop:4673 length:927 start_codon:yes stop_codon:yes gene_type:complete